MSDQREAGKQAKRDGRKLWEQSRQAFEWGDYLRERQLCEQVVASFPGTDIAQEAKLVLVRGRPDRVAWVTLGLAVLVYALVWMMVL